MTTVAQASAAPHTLNIGDRCYRVRPFRDIEFGEFEAWARGCHLEAAREIAATLPPGDREAVLQHAFDKAAMLSFSSPEVLRCMATIEGAVKLARLSIRRDHPDATDADLRAWLSRPGVINALLEAVDRVNGDGQVRVKKNNEPGPAKVIDKAEAYRYFAEKYYWPPEVVSRMTPAQMEMYIEGAGTDKRTGKKTRKFATREEAEMFMRSHGGK